jgi:hypothetical protein
MGDNIAITAMCYDFFVNLKVCWPNIFESIHALFSFENFLVFRTVALLFLFDKYCSIME